MSADTKLIVNLTRGTALCRSEVANRVVPRLRGLAGRHALPAGHGLLLAGAPTVHTPFNRFAVDALFLDSELRVVDIRKDLRPWRVAARRDARAVLELASGESHRLGVRVGDQLTVREGRPVAAVAPPAAPAYDAHAPVPLAAYRPRVPDFGDDGSEGSPSTRPLLVGVIGGGEPALADAPGAVRGDDDDADEPIRVLVISPDRRFRSVTTVLIARRGCAVATTEHADRLPELADRIGADVVVIDLDRGSPTSAAAVADARALPRAVGVVLVDEEEAPAGGGAQGQRVHGKWGPFEALFAAIEAADRDRTAPGGDDGIG